jgi:hypothetical protein
MGNNYYFDSKSEIRQLGGVGDNARIFILAGLLGAILGLISTLSLTYLTLAIWPIGQMPYTPFTALLTGTLGMIRTFSVILLIMGVYGLSVQYKAPILILVVALDAVVLILNEIVDIYLAATGDTAALVILGLGTFFVGSIASIIFGITIFGLRDRSSQPEVFTVFGLIEIMWPFVYFFVTITYVSLAYFMSQGIAILIGVLLVVLYWNEHRSGPLFFEDESDSKHSSQVWE